MMYTLQSPTPFTHSPSHYIRICSVNLFFYPFPSYIRTSTYAHTHCIPYPNILEDQVARQNQEIKQTRQCVSRRWMDEGARKLRRIDSIKEIVFMTSAE